MIRPAAYPAHDSDEHNAISFLESAIDPQYIKTEIRKRDKFPNIDGFVEIVRKDGEVTIPIGKLEVQIKKIPSGATSFSCPTSLVAYSEQVTTLPLLLICVDPESKRAFWKHISRSMPEFKDGQNTFTVKFDPAVDSIDPTNTYVHRWNQISIDYKNRVSNYPSLNEQIIERLGLESVSKEDIAYFQQFIDTVNWLFDHDFKVLKSLYFGNAWKLGVGIYFAAPEEFSYQIYRIPFGTNAPLVASFAGRNFADIWEFEKMRDKRVSEPFTYAGCDILQAHLGTRNDRSPEAEAKTFVAQFVKRALKERHFSISGTIASSEHIFEFTDHFAHTIGLSIEDAYRSTDLNYGLKVFLPAWYRLAFENYEKEYAEILTTTGVFPSFEEVAGVLPLSVRPSNEQVKTFIENNKAPFKVPIFPQFFSINSVIDAVELQLEQKVEIIRRVYVPRKPIPGYLWEGYDTDSIRKNVFCIIENAFDEYRQFVARNGLQLNTSLYLDDNIAFVFAGNFSEWPNRGSSRTLGKLVVRNSDRKLPKVTLVEKTYNQAWKREGDSVIFQGIEREMLWCGSRSADGLFERFPMSKVLYGMLTSDLISMFGTDFDTHERSVI